MPIKKFEYAPAPPHADLEVHEPATLRHQDLPKASLETQRGKRELGLYERQVEKRMNRDRKMTSGLYFQFSLPGFLVTVSLRGLQQSHKIWYVAVAEG